MDNTEIDQLELEVRNLEEKIKIAQDDHLILSKKLEEFEKCRTQVKER
ncbi:MAG: hypothetical protein QXN66_04050 [Thermoplasmatales archaeon]